MKRFVLAAIGICCMENGFSDERIYLLDIVQSDKLEMTLGTPVWNGSGFELGANLEISGGEKDYAYLWSPSEYLNDAFIANPVTTDSDKRDYTLTVTDSRECSCSATVSTGADGMEQTAFSDISVFPNPATEHIYVSFFHRSESVRIQLVNMLGMAVWEDSRHVETNDIIKIDAEDFPRGLYLLNIHEKGNEKAQMHKIILK